MEDTGGQRNCHDIAPVSPNQILNHLSVRSASEHDQGGDIEWVQVDEDDVCSGRRNVCPRANCDSYLSLGECRRAVDTCYGHIFSTRLKLHGLVLLLSGEHPALDAAGLQFFDSGIGLRTNRVRHCDRSRGHAIGDYEHPPYSAMVLDAVGPRQILCSR